MTQASGQAIRKWSKGLPLKSDHLIGQIAVLTES
jgi:hypothetical protein